MNANVRTLEALHRCFESLGVRFEGAHGVHMVAPAPAAHPGAARTPAAGEPLHRTLYTSRLELSRVGSMRATLEDIQRAASARNGAEDLTGALAVQGGQVLAVLEGPEGALRRRFEAIRGDPRHGDLRVLDDRPIVSRQFLDWTLCCGLFAADAPLVAAEPLLRDGLAPALLAPISALGLLVLLRDLQALPPRAGRVSFRHCRLAGACQDATCAAGGPAPQNPGD